MSRTCVLLTVVVLAIGLMGAAQDPADQGAEEVDYYRKWLNEDVVYIISSEEKAVFASLSTPEEKEQFIEQFWFRRDTDPLTSFNEFKEEHYRRIAYANDHFSSGIPGWRTDRGQIYIVHGEPAEIDSHPNVGNYDRPLEEGGGATAAFPFEIWRYRNIEGLGSNIEIEFVDPTMTGEYRLAMRPEDKDALLFTPGAGLTLAETSGMAGRADRPYFKPGNEERYPYMSRSSSQNPFSRYELLAKIQAPASIKYQDLKEMVRVNVAYESLPLRTRADYFRLNENESLVPVTFELDNRFLMFKAENGTQVAKLAVYGVVTTMTNRVVTEFEEDVVTAYPDALLEAGLKEASVYQRVLILETRQRYKLDLIVKDLNSSQFGVTRIALNVVAPNEAKLAASSLVLSDSVRLLDGTPGPEERFVLGDLKIHPRLDKVFSRQGSFWVYLHVYNFAVDQSTASPRLRVTYRLVRDGEPVWEATDVRGESTQYFSRDRAVLARPIPIDTLADGKHNLLVQVEDTLRGQHLQLEEQFEVRR